MIFKRLFSVKWRKDSAAPAPVPHGDLSGADSELTGRRLACKESLDLGLLARLAADDPDATIRDLAMARLRKLLSGREPESPPLTERLAQFGQLGDDRIACFLALQGKEPELRRTALGRVNDAGTLAEAAFQDPAATVRLAAVERIQDKVTLERVLRQMGSKDKSIYRLAKQKLKTIADQEQAPLRLRAELEALCVKMERLGRRGTWVQDQGLLNLIDKQWDGAGAAPADLAERFQQARASFLAGLDAYQAEHQARARAAQNQAELLETKQGLILETQQLADAPDDREPTSLEPQLSALRARWEALDPLPEGDEALARQFHRAAQAVEDRLTRWRTRHEQARRLDQLLSQGEEWLRHSDALEQKNVLRTLERGADLVTQVGDPDAGERFRALREHLQARLDKQAQHARQKLDHLDQRLTELEQALDEGALRKATSLHQSLHADLTLIGASTEERGRLTQAEHRLRHLTPRLRDLQHWRKWGTDQHRAELCDQMEALVGAELALNSLAERVQELQLQWKSLDQGGSPVNENLWRRFHEAADRAYARCRPFLEEQARQREANRQTREALCQDLEAFLDQVDWERMDWKKALRAERELRDYWPNLGEVEPRQRRGLERRFHAALTRLGERINGERSRNRALKQDLVTRAEALAQGGDLEQAMREIRALQQAWHTSVPSKRHQENQLWTAFRAACDRVFERRRELQDAHHQEQGSHVALRQALCEELEALARNSTADAERLAADAQQLQERWEQGRDLELPRQEAGRLQRRWQNAWANLQDGIRQSREGAKRREQDLLRERARLCQELELAAESGTGVLTQDWTARWDAQEPLADAQAAQAIRTRFQATLDALADPAALTAWRARLAVQAEQRRRLCLHLEVLNGVESPPEVAQERLLFQVARLRERLGQGEVDPLDNAPAVEQAWYLCGPAPADQTAALEARFERARVPGASQPHPGDGSDP